MLFPENSEGGYGEYEEKHQTEKTCIVQWGSIQEFIILLEERQKVRPTGEGDKPHVNKLQRMAIVKRENGTNHVLIITMGKAWKGKRK